jgi:hypothetical protein
LLSRVEHDEVIAETVHFSKCDHEPVYRRRDRSGPVAP